MKIIENLSQIDTPFKNAVITIGNFDGVHKGHQALLKQIKHKAAAIDGTSIAITFEPHPEILLNDHNHLPLITMYKQKLELIEQQGPDVLIVIPFTHEFASMSARVFVEELLIKKLGTKVIFAGDDYRFGKQREGDITLLNAYAKQFGFEVIVIDWRNIEGFSEGRISSTIIRETIMAGDVGHAVDMLGRYYQIRGTVVRGRNRGGKLLGFPTANINLVDELAPKNGVYAVTVQFDGQRFNGVANIGYSPTFDDHIFTVEVFIFDFKGDLYGRTIRVNFISRLRDEQKFSGISELSEQIKNDVENARNILSAI